MKMVPRAKMKAKKGGKTSLSQTSVMALFPSSLSSILSFVAKDEEVQIVVIPGSFGFVFDHSRTFDHWIVALRPWGKATRSKLLPSWNW